MSIFWYNNEYYERKFSMKPTKEDFLQKAKNYAISRGGECLSTEYISGDINLEWKCHNLGHKSWMAGLYIVGKKSWCAKCAKEALARKTKLADGLEQAHQLAEKNGGQCLSTEYINAASKLLWKCKNHSHSEFFSVFSDVKKGRWCSKCGDERVSKLKTLSNGLELAKELAIKNDGQCLSTEYINNATKMLWSCSNSKHPNWTTTYNHIKKGSWCPECKKLSEDDVLKKCHHKAKCEGGVFLSTRYTNRDSKLKFKCNNNEHAEFETTYDNVILHDTWCPECVGIESPEKIIEKAKEFAKTRGGKCLSDNCKNKSEKLLWQCANSNHKPWKSLYTAVVKNSRWCPICANFLHYKENKVRNILNYLFDTNFSRSKPSWNINPKTNKKLELDGYSEELNMAFEFQGLQHYKQVPYFKVGNEELEYIQYKDKIKKENCLLNKVKLIIINDTKETNKNEGLLNEILDTIKKENLKINKYINMKDIQKILNEMTDFQKEGLKKANDYALSQGGRCLSTSYSNYCEKLEWKCDKNHPSWFRPMSIIAEKSWCKQCAQERKRKKK